MGIVAVKKSQNTVDLAAFTGARNDAPIPVIHYFKTPRNEVTLCAEAAF